MARPARPRLEPFRQLVFHSDGASRPPAAPLRTTSRLSSLRTSIALSQICVLISMPNFAQALARSLEDCFQCRKTRTYVCEETARPGQTAFSLATVRRDLLNHVIVLNQRHLRRLMKKYVRYYHEDRTHLGPGKDTPSGRAVAVASPSGREIVSLPRLGGLHHRYTLAA
jgi:hypothetical protein